MRLGVARGRVQGGRVGGRWLENTNSPLQDKQALGICGTLL